MSSGNGPRGNPNYHYGASEGDHNKRKRPYFASSTRRDFKSSGPDPVSGRPSLSSDRRASGELVSRLRYRDLSRDPSLDYRDNPRESRDSPRDSAWDGRDGRDNSLDTKDYRDGRMLSRDLHRDSQSFSQSQSHNPSHSIGHNQSGQGLGHRDTLSPQASSNHIGHRDSANLRDLQYPSNSSNPQMPSRNPRSNSYSKDYRYGSYNKSYSSYNSSSYSERSGAYGSFNGSKRSDSDYFFNRESRDRDRDREREGDRDRDRDRARDRDRGRDSGGFREAWRSEKPRQTSSSRFNPNNIPVNLRSSLGHADSSSNDHKKERYDNYDDQASSRYYSSRRADSSRSENRPDSRDLRVDNRSARDAQFRPETHTRPDEALDYANRPSHLNRDRQHSANNVIGPTGPKREAKSFSAYQNRHTDHYPNGYGGGEYSEGRAFGDQSRSKSVSDFKQQALVEAEQTSDGHRDAVHPNKEISSSAELTAKAMSKEAQKQTPLESLENQDDKKESLGAENPASPDVPPAAVVDELVDVAINKDVGLDKSHTIPTSERTDETELESAAGDEESEYVPSEDIRTDRTDKADLNSETSQKVNEESRKQSENTNLGEGSDEIGHGKSAGGSDDVDASTTQEPADASFANEVSETSVSKTSEHPNDFKAEELPSTISEAAATHHAVPDQKDESAAELLGDDDEAEVDDESTEAEINTPLQKDLTKSPSAPSVSSLSSTKKPTFAQKSSTTDIFGLAEPTVFGIFPKKEEEPGLSRFVPPFFPEAEPPMYPDGCVYPQTKLEAEFCLLQKDYQQKHSSEEMQARTSRIEPVQDFTHLQFYSFNLSAFVTKHETLSQIVRESKKATKRHQLQLWADYELLRKENEKRVAYMDEQLRVLHPGDDEATRELLAIDTRQKNGTVTPLPLSVEVPQSGRRNRRHGDLVTTEAEFQEILKTLENEENESPIAKAKRVAATIPDLIVDPVMRDSFMFMDSNNFVFDKQKWADRVNTDFVDTFTEKEHDLFCEAYCQYPKKFGQVSQAMGGLRLSQECVLHYYMTKKAVNYKLLLSQYKKKSKKAIRRRKKKSVVSATPSLDELGKLKEDTDTVDGAESGKMEDDSPIVESADTFGKRGANHVSETPEAEQPLVKRARVQNRSDLERSTTPTQGPVVENDIETDEMEDDEDELRDGLSNDEKRKNISSYWSITETNDFPHLLNQFGSQWSKIAEKLSTKSATMVRNQYQRKGKEFGWFEVVRAADQRLARKPYVSGENRYSNFDTTLIVKPQRSTNVAVPNTEIHVYDAAEAAAVAAANAANAANSAHSASSSRISVSNLMGSPLAPSTMSTFSPPTMANTMRSAVPETVLPSPSAHFFTQSANHAIGASSLASNAGPPPATKGVSVGSLLSAASPIKTEGVQNHPKPSIMNLLNVESPVKDVSIPDVGGKSIVTEARAPPAPPATNNIASLLNTPSSPAAPQHSTLPSRSSNINSLLG